jgi:hypothetical protein
MISRRAAALLDARAVESKHCVMPRLQALLVAAMSVVLTHLSYFCTAMFYTTLLHCV